MSVFDNCQIALDLGISVGFKKKVELRKAITENGGVVSYIVTQKCSFVVASDPEKCDVSSKCRMALKYCLPVVSVDYIWDSLHAGKRLAIDRYAIGGKSKGLDFRFGKISALKKQATKAMSRHTVKPHFNIRNVKVWEAGDPDEPHFDENFEIAKYAVFQGQNKKQDLITFYSLEIHVGSNADKGNGSAEWQYRLYSHFGNLTDAVAGNPCKTEIHHVANADQALAGFATLYSAQMKDHKMQKVEGTMLRNVGSRKLQQILSVLESEMGVASPEVQNLTEHIWLEAIGEVEAVLASPISSVKVEEVEKAEALLVKIRDALGKEADGDVTSLVKEFYSTLPHKAVNGDSVRPSRAWLSKKQDLCQLIRDMVSVSEATSWSARSSAQAKYRALRCNISYLEPGTQEHKQIMEDVVSSINKKMTINITNIYAVQRPIEDAHFQHEMNSKRHLFHSSKVENFLGILSRGLLLPKVVADDFGGTRTDAGMLGCGVYFASDASKSALYSTPSKTKGTRLLLVNEVALGRCYDYTAIDTTLTKPPEGYDSVHGVGKKNDNSSHFEDDEYVVYSVNQQRLRYLVEFTINQEQPRSMVTLDNVLMETEDLVFMESCEIDLHDVQNVRDPMEGVKLGLVVENQEGLVDLKSVHVRAKLVDLAAQVIVLQEYVNNSMYPVEAKYVFPLGDGAAVCGFEAFINDKHIVGEVKEKETAHREYKQAISEGHGAYLMDQDEETPDVFTVSVGNLPPGATVLIKITYVAELQVEEELISFRLPGSVAPWKKESACKEKTQDKMETFKLSSKQVSIQVAVEMPFDIKSLVCPTHSVRMKKTATKAVIELNPGQDIQEGFQILIGLAEIHVPRMWVERHPDQPDHEACMLTFYPEFEVGSEVSSELVLLLDVSNSMKGASLQSAKKIAKLILLAIDASWKFNVVVFGTRYTELFPCAQPKNETTLEQAEKFIQQAQADMGNTEVFRPLHAYFLLPPANHALRNVFLISDGHLNNESSVLMDASSNYHHTRIFTFGVSSTCNAYSLRALARISAGSFEFFDTKVKSKWEEKVKNQLQKAAQPGLTSVRVEWRQYDDNLPPPVQAPCRITALFNGTRQVIYGFVPNCTMAFLSAVVGGQEVSTVVSTSDLAATTGLVVHRLTARALIQDWETGMLSDDRTHHEVVRMDEKQSIIELSKEYSIVTQFTSFIAVEKRDKDEDMSKKGPSIIELVRKESIDILDYMGWQEEAMDIKEHQPLEQEDVTRTVRFLSRNYVSLQCLSSPVSSVDTVENLKKKTQLEEGTPVDSQYLLYEDAVEMRCLEEDAEDLFDDSESLSYQNADPELYDLYEDTDVGFDGREQTGFFYRNERARPRHDSFIRKKQRETDSEDSPEQFRFGMSRASAGMYTLSGREELKRTLGEALDLSDRGIRQPAYSPVSPMSYRGQSLFSSNSSKPSYPSPGVIDQSQPAAQEQNLMFEPIQSNFQQLMGKSKEGSEPAKSGPYYAQSVFLRSPLLSSRRAEPSVGLFGSPGSMPDLCQKPDSAEFSGTGFGGRDSSVSTSFGTAFGSGWSGRSGLFGAASLVPHANLAAEQLSRVFPRPHSAGQEDEGGARYGTFIQTTALAAPFSFAQATPSAALFAQATPSAALFAQATPSPAPLAQTTPSVASFSFTQATPSLVPFAQTTPSAASFSFGQATSSAAPFAQATPSAALFGQATPSAALFAQATPTAALFGQATPSPAPFSQSKRSVAGSALSIQSSAPFGMTTPSAATTVGGGKPEVLKNAPGQLQEGYSSAGAIAERVVKKKHEMLSETAAKRPSLPQSSELAAPIVLPQLTSLMCVPMMMQMPPPQLGAGAVVGMSPRSRDTQEPPAPPPPFEPATLVERSLGRAALSAKACRLVISPQLSTYSQEAALREEPDQEGAEFLRDGTTRNDAGDEEVKAQRTTIRPRSAGRMRSAFGNKITVESARKTQDGPADGPEETDAMVFGFAKKKMRKKKAFLDECVISRFESEIDFIQRQLEFQVGGKSGLLDAKGQVPAIREAESNRTIDQWLQPDVLKTLLLLPDKEGEWSLDLQLGLVLHADVEACRQLLFSSGLRSFGESAASSLQKVVATLLVLISLLQVLLPDLSPPDLVLLLKASIARFADSELQCKVRLALEGTKIELPNDLMSRLEKALGYCKVMDERHPLACSSLELASDWPTFCANLLGLA